MKPIQQYLQRYAEPEAREILKTLPTIKPWSAAMVVPLLAENNTLWQLLNSVQKAALHSNQRVAIIAVLNSRPDDEAWIHEDNEELRKKCLSYPHHLLLVENPPITLVEIDPDLNLLLIDRAADGSFLPKGQGVGLARKIGADVALQLHCKNRVLGSRFYCTDGDAIVPLDYFNCPLDKRSDWGVGDRPGAAILFPFRHETPSPLTSVGIYEQFLKYYVTGLRYAGSPYAFHTLGSTLLVSFEGYAEVRGFPKRMAGEDFYLLNKLAKVGTLWQAHTSIVLQERSTVRVPFGTAQRTEAIERDITLGLEMTVYAPESFFLLKAVLKALNEFSIDPREDVFWTGFKAIGSKILGHSPRQSFFEKLDQTFGINRNLRITQRTRRTPTDRIRHLHTWFDAFRTLKFVHFVRDTLFSNIALTAAQQRLAELER